MKMKIVLLPGDGIGAEIMVHATKVLDTIAKLYDHEFKYEEHIIGGIAIDTCGNPLPDETLEACKNADAILLGAVGGPKWSDPNANVRPEQGLLKIRKELGVFANLRPIQIFPDLLDASPLKPEIVKDVDMIVVRELTGGLYFGQPSYVKMVDGHMQGLDTLVYNDYEVERIARMAFELASTRRKKVTSVDKANVLDSSRLWRQVVIEVAKDYPDITLEHMLVDAASMRLISNPSNFDVIVTENMFGDILTDEASVIPGSMGVLPSASVGSDGPGLFEPIHGSAPDIMGKGIANPIGMILSAAMMLRFAFKMEAEAAAIEQAVDSTLSAGFKTVDLGGDLNTQQMSDKIIEFIKKI
ncbi:MAG: 3-isopropylmalate dehydrogenase [Anaerolineaceae bacterium]|nr:3-isopropylmalate dehydrogenase [Anaerolineaceae bacterium]